MPYKVDTSFYEELEKQLGMLNLDERRYKIAEQIIGSIDEDGYLRRNTTAIVDDLAFRQNIDTSAAEVEEHRQIHPCLRSCRRHPHRWLPRPGFLPIPP